MGYNMVDRTDSLDAARGLVNGLIMSGFVWAWIIALAATIYIFGY